MASPLSLADQVDELYKALEAEERSQSGATDLGICALEDCGALLSGDKLSPESSGLYTITTGASGETNILSAPSVLGMVIGLLMIVDGGGNRVVTVRKTINQTGNNTITFADAMDFILLRSVVAASLTGGYRWQVISNNGAALSTV